MVNLELWGSLEKACRKLDIVKTKEKKKKKRKFEF
jgi:hypothetical protein